MGYQGMRYSSPQQIWDEIRSLSPLFTGITYSRIEKTGLQWPCPSEDHPGTQFLYEQEFARRNKRALFQVVHHQPPTEGPDEAFPLLLTTGRQLEHYHTGTQTRRSQGIDGLRGEELVEISPSDAHRLEIEDGDRVQVQSRRGHVEAKAQVTDRSPAGTVFMSFHFRETPTNLLTIDSTDPIVDTAELKACAVRVARVGRKRASSTTAGLPERLPAGTRR
jgi:predicted molibdopterin-dependent oxidoreductase YjgC